MGKLKKNIFLRSKVAKKTFFTFVLCSIIPLLLISAISLLFVGRQLENEAKLRLRQQCKNKGFLIYDRLTALENDLKNIGGRHLKGYLEKLEKNPYDPIDRKGSGWRRIFLWIPDGRMINLVEHSQGLPMIKVENLVTPENDRTIIDIIHSDDISPTILLTRYLDPERPMTGFISGEIDPLYLWGIGTTGALPPEIEMSVVLDRSRILISSISDYLINAEFLEAHGRNLFSGNFESTHDGKPFVNSYWSLFLNHRFSSPDWTIIFSQSRSSIMAPVTNFKSIFFLLVLLTFWAILLLSIRSIRRRYIPIDKLKAGAVKIASGDLDYRVEVTSGDEYEDLADAFNDMSSKLKKSRAMMLQTAKMSTIGQMGAGIVHEIGQPLTAISGYAELLQMCTAPEKSRRYLGIICEETDRLREIIAKFRTFTRASDERYDKVSISEILHNTLKLMDHQFKVNNVDHELEIGDHLPTVYGDKNGLQQVFLNLINNAVDALEEKQKDERKIRIRATSNGDAVRIEIADNGCGIPEEIQQSIFDPFFTTKGEDKGTGLGLSIIGTILQKHNASIQLASDVNHGTCFTISIPAI